MYVTSNSYLKPLNFLRLSPLAFKLKISSAKYYTFFNYIFSPKQFVMNTKKFLIGGIVGGVVYFLLGWLVYGHLLTNYFHDHSGNATGVERDMDQMIWWALILGNLLS